MWVKNARIRLVAALFLPACGGSSGDVADTDTEQDGGNATTSGSTTPGTDPVPPGETQATGTTSASTTSLPQGDGCCEPHAGAGCDEDAVEDCVCRTDASCCVFDWDMVCVNAALGACEASCMPQVTGLTTATTTDPTTAGSSEEGSGSSTSGGVNGGNCCMPLPQAGCEVAEIQTCVCALDPFCCNQMWDMKCVQSAQADCDAIC